MKKSRLGVRYVTLGLAALLAACSTPPASGPAPAPPAAANSTPAYLLSPTGCALVAGGGLGSEFLDRKITAVWDKINEAITNELHGRLVRSQYKVSKFIVPTERAGQAQDLVVREIAASRCSRLLQVAHQVGEDAAGRYFRFDVTLMRMQPPEGGRRSPAGHQVTTVSEFKREYRYPRTKESFDSFHTGTFAERVFADLTRSGALAPIR